MQTFPAILAYHKVGTPEMGGTWCTRRQLRAQLAALTAGGWAFVDAATFERRIDAGTFPSAAHEVLMTFDDAFASFGAHAWPELERAGAPAIVFVVSEFVGQRSSWDWPLPGRRVPHLDWAELRALAAAGVTIGAHSATHRDLRRLDDHDLDAELRGARIRLEDGLGVAIRSVAYPFGRSDARVHAATRAAGYTLGFSMCPPTGTADRWALRRHGVYVIDSPRTVLDKVDAARPGHAWQDRTERAINACAALVSGTVGRPRRTESVL